MRDVSGQHSGRNTNHERLTSYLLLANSLEVYVRQISLHGPQVHFCMRESAHPLAVSENAHNSRTTCYILMKFCIVSCVTTFFNARGFAEHQSSRSSLVGKNAHNS